ncbi:MAG: endonuclease [Thermomicrobiales bacterium]|jgi:endonuclease-3|nr:endonuclease [Thermomicrobiales bacterium]
MGEGDIKRPFDIDEALTRIHEAVRPYPKAAMFELAERGYASPFEQLIACLISVRTYDEVSLPAAQRLFEFARTPDAIAQLPPAEIDALIRPATFHDRKAVQIRDIARRVADEFGGDLPCDAGTMQSFAGIGPKCAHLALGVACGAPVISVDIHVHRICNRWGVVRTATPEQTMTALEGWLPERYRVEINRLLVPFGKHICTGVRPKCSTCPVLDMCRQVGVTSHR